MLEVQSARQYEDALPPQHATQPDIPPTSLRLITWFKPPSPGHK